VNRSVIVSSIRVGFETLRANPLRTLLSTLGIIMGVASMVSVLSLGDGVEQFARQQIARSTDLQHISVVPRLTETIDGQSFPRTDVVRFTQADAESLQSVLGDSGRVALRSAGTALVTIAGDTTRRAAQVIGAALDYQGVYGPVVQHGRWLNDEDARAVAPVVVLSRALARELAAPRPPEALLDTEIQLQGVARRIVGLLEGGDDGPQPKLAYVPLTALDQVVVRQPTPRVPMILLKVMSVESVLPMRGRVEAWLSRRYGAWKERVDVGTNTGRVEQAQQGILIFKLLMGALTGISLVVGGIGIMNVLLASVVERTREIGIRKATGAQQRHILLQFLSESVTISGVGSLIGIAVGVAAAYGVTAIMRSASRAQVYAGFSVSTFLVGVLASVVVGLLFGLYPAMRAARLSPIEAMHNE
jgi:putative ABC transport system permease protein